MQSNRKTVRTDMQEDRRDMQSDRQLGETCSQTGS